MQRFRRRQIVVETLECSEEPVGFFVPGQGFGAFPTLLTSRDGEPPIEQVAHMRQNWRGGASRLAATKLGESLRGVADRVAAAVGKRSQGVTQEVAFRIRIGSHNGFSFAIRIKL